MKKVLLTVVAVSLVGLIGLVAFLTKDVKLKSVAQSGEYNSTTTASGTAAANYTILTGPGTLGSIVVASTSASTFTVLDADGTSTTTLVTLKASIGENTYTFDRALKKGLILTIPSGFNGQYITTYR